MVNELKENLVKLRRELHKYPELSNQETKTASFLTDVIQKEFPPDLFIPNIGGNGFAAVYEGSAEGPAVMLRSELDALPIHEINEFDYRSSYGGIAHKCGHDGHMAILTGCAAYLSAQRPEKGKAILLFQPAEETGEGGLRVVSDEKFSQITPDYVFALHNLPGFEKHTILLKEGHFAAASKGMIIRLKGKTSHAAEPERGNSPAKAVSDIIRYLSDHQIRLSMYEDFSLITVIHARLGEQAFGTTPGYGEVMATLRSIRNDDMEKLTADCINYAAMRAEKNNLKIDISFTEEFPATINDPASVGLIRKAAEELNLPLQEISEPFRWSEDFGYFTKQFPGAFFGLGAGCEHPDLHNPDYDFPDDLLETGVALFLTLTKNILR